MFFLFFILLFLNNSILLSKDLGAGITLGTKSGLSFSYEDENLKKDKKSISSIISLDKSNFFISGDLINNRVYVKERKNDYINLPYYYGFGFAFDFDKDFNLIFRIPLGIRYRVEKEPVEFFGEFVPSVKIIKETEGEIYISIGVRYIFKI